MARQYTSQKRSNLCLRCRVGGRVCFRVSPPLVGVLFGVLAYGAALPSYGEEFDLATYVGGLEKHRQNASNIRLDVRRNRSGVVTDSSIVATSAVSKEEREFLKGSAPRGMEDVRIEVFGPKDVFAVDFAQSVGALPVVTAQEPRTPIVAWESSLDSWRLSRRELIRTRPVTDALFRVFFLSVEELMTAPGVSVSVVDNDEKHVLLRATGSAELPLDSRLVRCEVTLDKRFDFAVVGYEIDASSSRQENAPVTRVRGRIEVGVDVQSGKHYPKRVETWLFDRDSGLENAIHDVATVRSVEFGTVREREFLVSRYGVGPTNRSP